jgi:hypothetical protein
MKPSMVVVSLIALAAAWRLGCAGEGGGGHNRAPRGDIAPTWTGEEPAEKPAPAEVAAIAPPQVCFTEGTGRPLDGGKLLVSEGKTRGVVPGSGGDAAELRFLYRRPSVDAAPLADGEVRRQIGLKLRAADGCNVVYLMWHIDPQSEIAALVKRNRDQHESKQCGVGGYQKLTPTFARPVPRIEPGSSHTMHAAIRGTVLSAWVDDNLVWQGDLGPDLADLRGPAGFRTDNVEVEMQLLVAGAPTGAAGKCPEGKPPG